ncbi:MAG: AtpZ/AtpI family protein [Candidatus Dadabacteria bacterium]|nr:AtpZ/AtpI family protein [Candidatus Dadabacteria bacterium]
MELALSVIAGLLVGQYFDKKLNTNTPWFTLLGLVIGLIAVINILFRLTKTDDNDNNEPK